MFTIRIRGSVLIDPHTKEIWTFHTFDACRAVFDKYAASYAAIRRKARNKTIAPIEIFERCRVSDDRHGFPIEEQEYRVHSNDPALPEQKTWQDLLISSAYFLRETDPHRKVCENIARLCAMPEWFIYQEWKDRKCWELGDRIYQHLTDTHNLDRVGKEGGNVR